jgi:hypothetical protein
MFTFILITLFAFLTIGFATQLADNYNKDTTELEETMGASTITETLDTTTTLSLTWKETFEEWGSRSFFENILDIIGFFAVGLFNIAKTMANFIFTPFAILGSIMTNILHIPLIVVLIIEALLILSIIFGVWSLVKTGR